MNDLTFFTNEEGKTLSDRFKKIISNNTQFFDVLVGYFRASGFYEIYEALENVEKIRILIGINTDEETLKKKWKIQKTITIQITELKNL